MTIKLTYDNVRKIIQDEGYQLVSEEYISNGKKIDLLCPQNHSWSTTLNNFTNQKSRCPECSDKAIYNMENVRADFIKNNYSLISKEYVRAAEKMESICPNGHTWWVSAYTFIKLKGRCPLCKGIKRYTIGEIRVLLEKEGYFLLSEHYKNAHQKLEVLCPNKHRATITMNGFLSRRTGCLQCAHNRPHTISSIKEFVESYGYKLISTAYSSHVKIDLLCPNDHAYKTSFYNFKGHNRRCPKCTKRGSSVAERELFAKIAQCHTKARKERFYNDPTNKKRYLELDIYVPNLNKAIEYDGTYYHSFEHLRKSKNKKLWSDDAVRNYHENKDTYFLSIGIQILHIKEEEWNLDKQACIDRCLAFLSQ